MKTMMALAALAAAMTVTPAARAQTDYTKETPEQRAKRLQWFNDARFGMFIHWGLYAVPAGEYKGKEVPSIGEWIMQNAKIPVSEYETYAKQFNPVKFNATEWVRTAKKAGIKYIVITSKHHDGFGLWKSEVAPDWCISATPYPGDPLKDLAAACKKEGLTLCFYHSIMDWRHPDWAERRAWHDKLPATPPDMDRYTAYMKTQLKELLTGYGKIGILWFDGEWEKPWTHERGVDLYNFVRGLQPEIIVNNRVGKGRKGMSGMDKAGEGVGDYGTPEQEIPPTGFGPGVVWESCMTMNDTWGFKKNDHNWKTTTKLIQNLIDCASKGGNYLLNVGPTAEGLIPFESVARLQQIGEWMEDNSESIYGTTASPFAKLDFGKCTTKGNKLYLHVFNAPANRILQLPGLQNQIKKAYFLADDDKTKLAVADNTIEIPNYPPAGWDPHATVIVAELDGAPVVK